MKKLLLLLALAFIQTFSTKAQITNDGFVTNYLSVDLSKSSIVSYMSGLESGITDFKNGIFSSANDVYSKTGINLTQLPQIDNIYQQFLTDGSIDGISSTFVGLLRNQIAKIGVDYNTVGELRNGFLSIVNTLTLNSKEAEALALADLSVQAVVSQLLEESSDQISFNSFSTIPNTTFSSINIISNDEVKSNINDFDFGRLPRWFRCGVGTIGSAILGGLTGIGGGFVVGGPLGLVVGGVVGVISGAMVGAASFCD